MDVLVYCLDTEKLKKELRDKHPEHFYEDELPVSNDQGLARGRFIIEKTPTKRNSEETLALVRCDSVTLEMLEALDSVQVLGTYEEVLASKKLKAIHDKVYPRKPTKYKDEDGKEHTHTPPERIGAFA